MLKTQAQKVWGLNVVFALAIVGIKKKVQLSGRGEYYTNLSKALFILINPLFNLNIRSNSLY